MTRMKRVLAAVLAALSLSLVTVLAADSIYLNTRQIKWHSLSDSWETEVIWSGDTGAASDFLDSKKIKTIY